MLYSEIVLKILRLQIKLIYLGVPKQSGSSLVLISIVSVLFSSSHRTIMAEGGEAFSYPHMLCTLF